MTKGETGRFPNIPPEPGVGPAADSEKDGARSAVPSTSADKGSIGLDPVAQPAGERGEPKGPEPTRYGDWEKGGRCFDF